MLLSYTNDSYENWCRSVSTDDDIKNKSMSDFRVGSGHIYGGMSNFMVLLVINLWYINLDENDQTCWRQWHIDTKYNKRQKS